MLQDLKDSEQAAVDAIPPELQDMVDAGEDGQ